MSRISPPHLPPGSYLEIHQEALSVVTLSDPNAVFVARPPEYWIRDLPVDYVQAREIGNDMRRRASIRAARWVPGLLADAELTGEEAAMIARGKDPYAVLAGRMPLRVVMKDEDC